MAGRGFGNPAVFVNQIAGQQGIFSTAHLQNYLRGIVVVELADTLGALDPSE